MSTETDPNAAPATPPADATPSADTPALLGADAKPVDATPDPAAKPAEGDKPADDKPAAEPEYKFEPLEGVEFDTPHLEKFTALAKELKLPPADAQKIVTLASEMELARAAEHATTVKGWLDAVKTDKELGGDKLAENLATARKTFSLLPAEQAAELKGLLNQTGLEAHPAFFRLFHAVGKALSEDQFVPAGKAATGAPKTLAERMYPQTSAA